MTEKPIYPPTTHALNTSRPWKPKHFEFTFGLRQDPSHDPQSVPETLTLPGGWKLRGAVDLIEESAALPNPSTDSFLALSSGASARALFDSPSSQMEPGKPENPTDSLPEIAVLRVTDHKTGANRTPEGMIVGGGEVLQPVLYSLAIESLLHLPVAEGRLYFCTTRGTFTERIIPIDQQARQAGEQVLETINRAIVQGWLMPMPRNGACSWCNFRSVCGPHEETRAANKQPPSYSDLQTLREMQ